jgi:dihydroflavonol-4-reductase
MALRVLVTGANGLVGCHVVRELLDAGYQVRAMVRSTSDRRSLNGVDVEQVEADLLDLASLEAAARGCDWLFHTAAVFAYWGYSPEQLTDIIVTGTENVVEAAHRSGVKRLIVTTSSVVMGSSTKTRIRNEEYDLHDSDAPPYFWAKALQEQTAMARSQALGLDCIALCPTITVGPQDYRLVPSNAIIVNYLKDPTRATYPGGCNIVSVRDVALGHRLAAEQGTPGQRYVLGSENWEWSLIHRTIADLCGLPGPKVMANHTSAYLTATAMEVIAKLTGNPPASTRVQARTVGRFYWYSHDKIAALGYSPRPARQALAEAIAWLVTSPHIGPSLRRQLKLSREVVKANPDL